MSIQGLEAKLLANLQDFFRENAFYHLPELRQFRKTTKTGFENVIFSFSPYDDELWVNVHFGTRHDRLEIIAQQFLSNRIDFREDANTLLTTIGRFRQRNYFRYKINNSEELEKTCEDICSFFVEKGFAFFDIARNIIEVDYIINDLPRQPCPYIYNPVHRYFKGLIAARLSENFEFETLFVEYASQLKKSLIDDSTKDSFEKLYSYLGYYSEN